MGLLWERVGLAARSDRIRERRERAVWPGLQPLALLRHRLQQSPIYISWLFPYKRYPGPSVFPGWKF